MELLFHIPMHHPVEAGLSEHGPYKNFVLVAVDVGSELVQRGAISVNGHAQDDNVRFWNHIGWILGLFGNRPLVYARHNTGEAILDFALNCITPIVWSTSQEMYAMTCFRQ